MYVTYDDVLLMYRCDPGQTRISACDEPSTTEWSTQAGHKAEYQD
jgi:hypothetical protein